MRAKGVSFRHAVELLRANHPSLAAPGPVVRKATTAAVKLETPFESDADDQAVLRQAVDYYHETLKESPEALQYLQGRGLEHPEMIDHFRLGFSNRTLGYRLPAGKPQRGRRDPGAAAAARHPARERPRALHRLRRDSRDRSRRQRDGDLRPEDHGRLAAGDAAAHLSARAAPGRLERRGA